jgi:hypothetical protein
MFCPAALVVDIGAGVTQEASATIKIKIEAFSVLIIL